MSDILTATFGDMVRASIGQAEVDGVAHHTGQGGTFRLPLDRAAVIESEAIGGRERVLDGVEWLAGDAAESPIMSRLSILATSQTRGVLPSGRALPTTSMQPESGSAALSDGLALPATGATGDLFRFDAAATGLANAVDEDGDPLTTAMKDATFRWNGTAWQRTPQIFGEHEYNLDSTVESKTEITQLLAMQAGGDFVMDSVLESQRLAIADTLLAQVLAGNGTGNNLDGIVNAAGIAGGTYVVADRGKSSSFQDAEDVVEQAGARAPYMAWAVGAALSTSARRVAIEPGGSRRTEEQGRLVLSGAPVQRIVDGLASTTGLCADWRAVVVPILSALVIVTDLVSRPGYIRITSRLPVADPIATHPQTIYGLAQA